MDRRYKIASVRPITTTVSLITVGSSLRLKFCWGKTEKNEDEDEKRAEVKLNGRQFCLRT